VPARSQFSGTLALHPPILYPPARPLPAHDSQLLLATRLHQTASLSNTPSDRRAYQHRRIKTHNRLVPNPRGFLHRAVSKPPRPQLVGRPSPELSAWPRCSRYGPRQYRKPLVGRALQVIHCKGQHLAGVRWIYLAQPDLMSTSQNRTLGTNRRIHFNE
jgi:hypothetical protein